MKYKNNLNFFTPSKNTNLDALLINAGISAGFPSPAGDFKQERISLDQELIKNIIARWLEQFYLVNQIKRKSKQ